MTPQEHVDAIGAELDTETKAKLLLVLDSLQDFVPAPRYVETLRYTTLGDIVAFVEAGV